MGIVRHFERLGLGGNERHFGLWPAAGLFWRRLLTDGSLAAAEDAALDAVDNEEEEVSALTGASGASSSRRELAELKRQLAVAQAKIRDLSEPQPTTRRKEFNLSMSDSSSDSESSSSSSETSSLPSASGGKAPGPVADVGA